MSAPKRARNWSIINPESGKGAERSRRYYRRHREELLERAKKQVKPVTDPDKDREYGRTLDREWRNRAVMFLGGRCEKCGIDDSRVLQIDHVDGGGWTGFKKMRSGRGSAHNVFGNPGGFQLLCANCNWIKKFECGEQPGYLAGRGGCDN